MQNNSHCAVQSFRVTSFSTDLKICAR